VADTVETVRGPVALERLGPTLLHEHVFILDPEAREAWSHLWGESYWDEERGVAHAVEKLRELRETGIETMVDATAFGLGRNIARIQRVNADVDLNIIVATGVYAFLELPSFLNYRSNDWIVELFVRELRDGIDDTGVKAAFIKCAVERHGLVGDTPRILECVAAAAVETDAPVMVHTNAEARTGLLALDALTGAGVRPERIVIAHAGDSNDLDYLHTMIEKGVWLGCDRFGIDHFNPDADRVKTLAALCSEGHAGVVHLGHDAGTFHDFMIGNPYFADERPSYIHISRDILPQLLEAGVTQGQIDQMLVENPQRFFA
jgi:phosphotriesterase-related protein